METLFLLLRRHLFRALGRVGAFGNGKSHTRQLGAIVTRHEVLPLTLFFHTRSRGRLIRASSPLPHFIALTPLPGEKWMEIAKPPT